MSNNVVKKYRSLKQMKTLDDIVSEDKLVQALRNNIFADDFTPIKPIYVNAMEHNEVFIFPLNDVHIGSKGCNIDKLIRYLDMIKFIPNLYIILNGDLLENANSLGVSSPLESAASPYDEQKILHKLLFDQMIRDKIIVSTEGNHDGASGNRMKEVGLSPLTAPMATLGLIELLAKHMARVTIKMKNPYSENGYGEFTCLVRHGSGRGGKVGRIVDSLFDMAFKFGYADAIFLGHTHKSVFASDSFKIEDASLQASHKKNVYAINAPAFQEASDYAMTAGYPIPNTDPFLIRVRPSRNLDLLDATEEEKKHISPWKWNVDKLSLDRYDLVQYTSKIKAQPLIKNKYSSQMNDHLKKLVNIMGKANTEIIREQ